ncbi:hypothetical protein [Ferdinandcohnia sp. SAFN-114]|uniref:hypothetical protein n=1 Tax=Ferdinandcohnia sp. SAFN-114 TaxID=3387275 RepID=UPI003F7D4740
MNASMDLDSIFQYTEQKLTSHFQNNIKFNQQFFVLTEFYKNKFNGLIKQEDEQIFGEMLFQCSKSQIFNGYFIMRELLLNNQETLSDEWFAQSEGILTEQLPGIIREAAQHDFDNIIIEDEMKRLIRWAITRYEDVYSTLHQISFDLVCYGAKQAVIDERDKKGIQTNEALNGLLGAVNDLNFISPQSYLTCNAKPSESEIWTLSWWSSIQTTDNKVGEVTVLAIPLENTTQYALNIYLSKRLPEHERSSVISIVLANLIENGIAREDIVMSYALVEEFYIFVPQEQK